VQHAKNSVTLVHRRKNAAIKPKVNERQIMKNQFLDILAAVAIGLLLTVGALAYFDVLTK
jgi:hypothetical protein